MAPEAKRSKPEIREGLIYGMGNPLLDISATVDHDLLKKYELKANDAILADEKHKPISQWNSKYQAVVVIQGEWNSMKYQELVEKYDVDYLPGGATQNTLRVAQWFLDTKKATSYIGCIGQDEFGKTLTKIMRDANVHVSYLCNPEVPTGTCAVCITDKSRSLVANLAAANHYSKDHLFQPENWSLVENANYFYIAGYFLTVSIDSIEAVGKHAAENNKMFMMNLSAPFLCQFFKEQMMKAMPYIDILFGNETEMDVFSKEHDYGTEDLEEIAKKIAALPKVNDKKPRMVVVTHGKEPTIVVQNGIVKKFPVIPIKDEEIIDTNGAGDAFAGGFLSQLVQESSSDECVRCGHWAANYIIKQSGVCLNHKPDFA